MRPFCPRSANCRRGRTQFHSPTAFPERKLCRRWVHNHRYGVTPPASQVCEKWNLVDVFRQSPPSADQAADLTCKLPRQPRIYRMNWARTYAADARESWIPVGPTSFLIPLTKSCCLPRSMRAYRNLLGKRRYASTNAPGSEISGDFTSTSDSHRSLAIAKSIQAWAHLMFGVWMVRKRRTR